MHASLHLPRHEIRSLQHANMFGDRRLTDLKRFPQFASRAFATSRKQSQHLPSSTVAQGMKSSIQLHLIMNSHMAILWRATISSSLTWKKERVTMVVPTEPDALVLRRRYAATADVVFDLWTRPELLAKWFRPSPEFTHHFVEVDARVGGRYRVAFESPEGQVDVVGGEYLEIVPAERLVFSWMWEPPNEHAGIESSVTVEFQEVDGETELVVIHQLTDPVMRERHGEGWTGALDQIPHLIQDLQQEGQSRV